MTFQEKQIPKILIVIPVFNEEKFIESLINNILLENNSLTILAVNDGSTDNSSQILSSLPVDVIHHKTNHGKGAAIQTACRYAVKHGYNWIITLDGDGQHPPKYLKRFIQAINKNNTDLILGNRQLRGKEMPLHRRLSNGTTSIMVSLCSGNQRIHDSQCGYRALKVNSFNIKHYKETGFQFESEMIMRMGRANYKIAEIPISTHYGNQESSINLFYDTLSFIKLILKSFFW